jgi:alpha-L-arabinofuranosidase
MPSDVTELCHKVSLINSKRNLNAPSSIYNSFQNFTSKVLKPVAQLGTRLRPEKVDDCTDLWQEWRHHFRHCVWKESWTMSEKRFSSPWSMTAAIAVETLLHLMLKFMDVPEHKQIS